LNPNLAQDSTNAAGARNPNGGTKSKSNCCWDQTLSKDYTSTIALHILDRLDISQNYTIVWLR
jgi:hypothetical protein